MWKKLVVILVFTMLDCANSQFNIIVASDGSGNVREIQEAIEHAPANGKVRFTIKVKAGQYLPFIVPNNKTNIALVGDGMESTVVTGNKSNGTGYSLPDTATAQVLGDHFVAQGLSFRNTAGPEMSQAVALLVEAREAVFYRCKIDGFQDSLYVRQGSQFFRECHVYGTIDFIFGNAQVVLQNSAIYLHQPLPGQTNVITAQNRNLPTEPTGIVLHNCTITAAQDFQQSSGVRTFLGRPWGDYSSTVVMQSFLPPYIDPQGWLDWSNDKLNRRNTVSYREYDNRGPGADTSKRVSWKGFAVIRNISEAQKYTVNNFLDGSTWLPSTGIPYNPDLITSLFSSRSIAKKSSFLE